MSESAEPTKAQIGTLRESGLHAALKAWYARPGDELEVRVGAYWVDIVRGEELIEIQTSGLGTLRAKLAALTPDHRVRLIYPIAQERWIVRLAADGVTRESRRRSPRKGRIEDLFWELVYFPQLLADPQMTLTVLLIQEEELRCPADALSGPATRRTGWRRRGWKAYDRRLLAVLEEIEFSSPTDLVRLLPSGLPQPFTTRDLARALGGPLALAQKMAHVLRILGILHVDGKRGHAVLYRSDQTDAV